MQFILNCTTSMMNGRLHIETSWRILHIKKHSVSMVGAVFVTLNVGHNDDCQNCDKYIECEFVMITSAKQQNVSVLALSVSVVVETRSTKIWIKGQITNGKEVFKTAFKVHGLSLQGTAQPRRFRASE